MANHGVLIIERYLKVVSPVRRLTCAGGRASSSYRDSYWVLKGLLLSEMHQTVRGMIENFLVMVERFGFVPNGGRVYFERRPQPPFLIPMVKLYLDATNDMDFIRYRRIIQNLMGIFILTVKNA